MALFTPKGLLLNVGAVASIAMPWWIQENTSWLDQIPSLGWVLFGIAALTLGFYALYYAVHSTAFISVDMNAGRININEGWQPSRLRDELAGVEFLDLESVNVNRGWFSGLTSGFAAWIEGRGVNPVLIRVLSTGDIKFVAKGRGYNFPGVQDPQHLKKQIEALKGQFMDQKAKQKEIQEAEGTANQLMGAVLGALRIHSQEQGNAQQH